VEEGERSEAGGDLGDIRSDSPAFDDENDLGQNDNRDDDARLTDDRLCAGLAGAGSETRGEPRYQMRLCVSAT